MKPLKYENYGDNKNHNHDQILPNIDKIRRVLF